MTDQDTGPRGAKRDPEPGPEPEPAPEPGPDGETEEPEEPDDEYHLQGHKIMTEEDLDEVFTDDDDDVEVVKRRRWRHVLHGAVLVLLLAGLAGAVVAAMAVMRGDLQIPGWGPRTQEPITCPSATYDYPANDSFTLNVYNSTNEGGLARQTAGELADRGYRIGEVASKDLNYYGLSAVVMSGPKGEANAMNLQRNIAGTEYVADDRGDDSVDVILGSRYEGLVPAKKVNKKPGTLSCPRLESADPARPATPDAAR